jgi:GT2 family glycosyltransferase
MASLAEQRVSMVLLTYNCARAIEETLARLHEANVPLIIVDNGSTDGTVARLRELQWPGMEIVALPMNVGAVARNEGLKRTRTPYVAFCDDDMCWDREGLTLAANLLDAHPRLGLVNARILVGDERRLDPISRVMERSSLVDDAGIPGIPILSFMAGAVVVRRSAWLAVGGYHPRFHISGEEEIVGWRLARAGWQMRYVPSVVSYHFPSLRNAPSLQHYGVRNTIWTAWLHLPARHAWQWTWHVISSAPKNRILFKGLVMSLPGALWIWRERALLPADLEATIYALHQRDAQDPARQYAMDLRAAKRPA